MTNREKKLVDAAAELIVTLRSWGMHQRGPLVSRDADTGEPIPNGSWAGEELQQLILQYRKQGI